MVDLFLVVLFWVVVFVFSVCWVGVVGGFGSCVRWFCWVVV